MLRLAILASGGGSNLKAILDSAKNGSLGNLKPVLCVTDRPCKALDIAVAAGIPSVFLDRHQHGSMLSGELGRLLGLHSIDIVALAGWLSILSGDLTRELTGRMVNIHPSLLPLHGGVGMYGRYVHKSVLDAGERESGCSVHLVTSGVDEGEVLGQIRVSVQNDDTPETLAERILIEEHKLYPQVLAELAVSLSAMQVND